MAARVSGPLQRGSPRAYRHDLRTFLQWCTDVRLDVLEAKRARMELWRSAMEERGLAASTIDRRLSTICGFYRFAHIDGRNASNPAQYALRPKVYPSEGRGLDGASSAGSSSRPAHYDPDRAALAALLGLNGLQVSEACATDAEDLGFDRGHRMLRTIGKGNKPAVPAGDDRRGRERSPRLRPRHEIVTILDSISPC